MHGISVDPESSKILLATHDGLYDATADQAVKVSDSTIDLMGFTATAEPGTFTPPAIPDPVPRCRTQSDSYSPRTPEKPGSRSPELVSPTSMHSPSAAIP
ncbi:hypothetical protein NHF46_00590 [Arthrobacter alpinus]|nr:hypothetical protein [Arthrobacter alpinus]